MQRKWRDEKRIPAVKALILNAKNRPCQDCGQRYPPYVMDFDHRYGKKFLIGRQVWSTTSVARVKEEIAKCDIVCANCHRERTYGAKSARLKAG